MRILEYCTRHVAVVRPDVGVADVARLMRQSHVGCLVVVDGDDGHPVGLITDRDLVLEVLAKDVDPQSITAADVMCPELETADEEDDVLQTLARMRSLGIRRMPVLGPDGRLRGILTVDDLLDVLTDGMRQLQQLISTETAREVQLRS